MTIQTEKEIILLNAKREVSARTALENNEFSVLDLLTVHDFDHDHPGTINAVQDLNFLNRIVASNQIGPQALVNQKEGAGC